MQKPKEESAFVPRCFSIRRRKFRIRELCAEDLPRLVEIERVCYSDPWSKEMFRSELRKRVYQLALGLDLMSGDEEVEMVGFLLAHVVLPELQILNVAVLPDHRRKGLAGRMLAAALGEAKKQKVSRAVLEVRVSNEAAQGLYRSFGFAVVGRRKAYYDDNGEDALTMVLDGEFPDFEE